MLAAGGPSAKGKEVFRSTSVLPTQGPDQYAMPSPGYSMPMIWFSTAHACAKVASASLPRA